MEMLIFIIDMAKLFYYKEFEGSSKCFNKSNRLYSHLYSLQSAMSLACSHVSKSQNKATSFN